MLGISRSFAVVAALVALGCSSALAAGARAPVVQVPHRPSPAGDVTISFTPREALPAGGYYYAVAVLAKLGYTVAASTGRPEEAAYLKTLGASEIVERGELTGPVRPLAKERWAAGIDVVGSTTLANVLSMTRYGGAVAACGLAGGMDLPASVAPFILRGVSLLGIDSVMCPLQLRQEAWRRH